MTKNRDFKPTRPRAYSCATRTTDTSSGDIYAIAVMALVFITIVFIAPTLESAL